MTEAEFDKLLRQALLEAVWQENKTYVEQAEEKDIEFSERYLKRREKMLQDPFAYAKKMSRTIWQRMARSAALFFVTLSLLFAMAMTVPSVRAAVLRLYTEWYETHISVHVQNSPKDKQSINLEDLFVEIPSDILPEGFKERSRSTYTGLIVYANENGETISLDYRRVEGASIFGVNNEGIALKKEEINGREFYLLEAVEADKGSQIMWVDEDKELLLCIVALCDIDMDELISLAESVLIAKT